MIDDTWSCERDGFIFDFFLFKMKKKKLAKVDQFLLLSICFVKTPNVINHLTDLPFLCCSFVIRFAPNFIQLRSDAQDGKPWIQIVIDYSVFSQTTNLMNCRIYIAPYFRRPFEVHESRIEKNSASLGVIDSLDHKSLSCERKAWACWGLLPRWGYEIKNSSQLLLSLLTLYYLRMFSLRTCLPNFFLSNDNVESHQKFILSPIVYEIAFKAA